MNNTGPIPDFLNKISKSWGLTFVYPKIWTVQFLNRDGMTGNLINNISKVLGSYRTSNSGWDNDFNRLSAMITSSSNIYKNLLCAGSQPNNDNANIHIRTKGGINHFILATKISTPNESVYIGSGSEPTNINGGGAIWGHYAGGRENTASRTIDITFLDTYKEFTEYIIRPWIIAVAHQGLIESSKFPCIKCDIKADFYAKAGPNDLPGREVTSVEYYSPIKTIKKYSRSTFKRDTPFLRKSIRFFNCVPIKLPEKNYNFAPDISADEAMTNITFAYDYYQVTDPTDLYEPSYVDSLVTTEGIKYVDSEGNELSDVLKDPIKSELNGINMEPDNFKPTTVNGTYPLL